MPISPLSRLVSKYRKRREDLFASLIKKQASPNALPDNERKQCSHAVLICGYGNITVSAYAKTDERHVLPSLRS